MKLGVQETIGDHFHGSNAGNARQDEEDHANASPKADLGEVRYCRRIREELNHQYIKYIALPRLIVPDTEIFGTH